MTNQLEDFKPQAAMQPDLSPAGPESPADDSTSALPSTPKLSNDGYYLDTDPSGLRKVRR